MRVLDLGCGWGSLSLWLAETYRNASVVGVSNSHGQREWIEAERYRRGNRVAGQSLPARAAALSGPDR
jgi:cyclopropane-fatty-acyl-phospholipid synthase